MKLKTRLCVLAGVALCLGLAPVHAQVGPGMLGGMGGAPRGPRLGGSIARLFGDNSAFSATLELQSQVGPGGSVTTMPGKVAFAEGKFRFEMDMTQAGGMPAGGADLKSMGMDRMVMISRPDKKLSYMVFPSMQAYMANPIQDPDAAAPASDFKLETTELGKETVDGHPCVKNKTVVTDSKGEKHEAVVWNATDLKNFPIKIEQTEGSTKVTMLYKDLKLSKPEDSTFDPPSDFKRHENMQSMMQEIIMKRMGAPGGMPAPGK